MLLGTLQDPSGDGTQKSGRSLMEYFLKKPAGELIHVHVVYVATIERHFAVAIARLFQPNSPAQVPGFLWLNCCHCAVRLCADHASLLLLYTAEKILGVCECESLTGHSMGKAMAVCQVKIPRAPAPRCTHTHARSYEVHVT